MDTQSAYNTKHTLDTFCRWGGGGGGQKVGWAKGCAKGHGDGSMGAAARTIPLFFS